MRFALPPDATRRDGAVEPEGRRGHIRRLRLRPCRPGAAGTAQRRLCLYLPLPGRRGGLPQQPASRREHIPDSGSRPGGNGIEISGLDSRPPVGIQEGVYRAWEGRGIPAGSGRASWRIDGLPQPGVFTRIGGTLSGGSFWLTAIPSAMGAAYCWPCWCWACSADTGLRLPGRRSRRHFSLPLWGSG